MNIRDLEYIILVDKFKHFGQAAKAGNISQPALSMQIQKFEDRLGIKIFERNNKKIITTGIGHEIVKIAKEIIHQQQQIINISELARDPLQGEIRIAAFPTLAPYLFPKLIPHLTKKFPKVRFFIIEEKTNIIIQKTLDGDIDIALLAAPIDIAQLNYQILFIDEFYLAVSLQHKFSEKQNIENADLENEELLLLEEGHCLRDQALDLCKKYALETNSFRASSLETLRQMVIANSGITLIPKLALDNNPALKYIAFKHNKPFREIGLVYRKTAVKQKLIKEIYAEIKNLCIKNIS